MIILDTNVISETSKPRPDPRLVLWLSAQESENLFLTCVTVMEIAYGGEKYRLKSGSQRYLNRLHELTENIYRNRILSLESAVAINSGFLRARREMSGFSMSVQDAQIAAICLSHDATLATRNTKDFEGLDLSFVNPFEGA